MKTKSLKYKTYYLSFASTDDYIVVVKAKNLKAAKIKASKLFDSLRPSQIREDYTLIDCQGYEICKYTPEDK